MKDLFKNHIAPLLVIFVLSISLTQLATAKTWSLADLDQAALTSDLQTLEEAYAGSEGRVKRVAGYRLVSIKLFSEELRDMSAGKQLLNELVADLEKQLEQKRRDGEAWAILASLRGMQIYTQPDFAAVYGPKIGLEMALATDYGKHHPVVFMLQGVNLYNTPAQFGGSKERALALLDRAIELYTEAESDTHWGLVDAYVWRGQAQRDLGKPDAARRDLAAAEKLVADSSWIQALQSSLQ